MSVSGNISGLKQAQKKALERLLKRRVPGEKVVNPELAHAMCLISREVGRQVGVFIDRSGHITHVAVGDQSRIILPDFGRIRAGERRFRGLRLVHTHLRSEPLSQDDLTDLTRLRLDMVVAIGVGPEGTAGAVYTAHLLPPSPKGDLYRQTGPLNVGMLPDDFLSTISSLEDEFRRLTRARRVDMPEGRAVLVHVASGTAELPAAERSLDELSELANTAGVEVVDRITQIRNKPDPRFVVGRGKLQDIAVRAMRLDAELIIIDRNIGPNQGRAIGEMTDCKVIDRTQLILDIFAQRAHSADGKLKVELAQLKYLLPRLGLKDDSLSRLTGGIGGRGPGETKLEIGRRRARDRIAKLERKLGDLSRSRDQRRAKRQRSALPIVSIVGYTNAGKSTLLNALTQSKVLVENRLFATLDTASRRLRYPRDREVIITDTVGFIRDLPQDLLDAFRATLEELHDADLLIHVVDVSDPMMDDQINSVEKILMDLGLADIRRLVVFNKIDLINPAEVEGTLERYSGMTVSALDRASLKPLIEQIEQIVWPTDASRSTSTAGEIQLH